MSPETPLAPGVWRMTSNLDDEDVPLYEGLHPIPHGIALHAYVVRGDKTLLIDPYFEGGYALDEVAEDLAVLGLTWNDVHFVALTHEPQDAAGLRAALAALPRPPRVLDLSDAQVALGQGRSVTLLPGMVLETGSGVLFSGKRWAGFGAIDEAVLSTEVNGTEARFYDDEALRWWITHPEGASDEAALPAHVTFLAPAHGLLWPNPVTAVERAQAWLSWGASAEDEIALVWSDAPEADALVIDLAAALTRPGFSLSIFRVPQDHESFVRAALWRASALVVGPGVDPELLRGMTKTVWRPEGAEWQEAAREFARSL